MDHKEYIDALVAELMVDSDWKASPELRFFLLHDLTWGLLNL